jgi:hypothetical protein
MLERGMPRMMLTLAGWLLWCRLAFRWRALFVMLGVGIGLLRAGLLRAGGWRVGREETLSRRIVIPVHDWTETAVEDQVGDRYTINEIAEL